MRRVDKYVHRNTLMKFRRVAIGLGIVPLSPKKNLLEFLRKKLKISPLPKIFPYEKFENPPLKFRIVLELKATLYALIID